MRNIATKTVREVVLENPAATRIFEQLGIDYCCGGHKPLEQACSAANMSVDEVLERLEEQPYSPASAAGRDWQEESLASLIAHITGQHHAFVRTEAPRIIALLDKVCGVHGARHPELGQARELFGGLAQELSTHLMKEEKILFPYIVQSEQHAGNGQSAPDSCFGTVQNPIRMMMLEHDNAGTILRSLRQLTTNYTPPADACISYQTLYQAMLAFEADLHQHIHLENNILFPRAMALE